MPVPRPHFPDDPHPAPAIVAEPATEPAAKPAPVLPLPPEKPAELVPKQTAPGSEKTSPPQKIAEPATPKAPMPPAAGAPKASAREAPSVAPSGARLGEAPGQPEDDASCPGRLRTRNVSADPITIGPQPDTRCTVVQAVRLTGLILPNGGKVDFPDRPTIACVTADAFSHYVRELLAPLAKGTYGVPVAAVWTGPGLECRSRDHIFGAKLSAHGQGLAIDIAQLKLSDGRMIEVGQPKTDAEQGFETASRAAACGYFHTVLGPGSDSYHRTHWHFDLEVRGAKGDSKFCK